MNAKERFYSAISALVPGNRDANLVRVATYGVLAGLSHSEVAEAIIQNAPGDTRPDPAAVRRAVENCYGTTKPRSGFPDIRIPSFSWHRKSEAEKREDWRRSLSAETRGSVRRYIEQSAGATADDLILMSPTPVPLDPRAQAAAFIRTIGSDWRWSSWFGSISSACKRGLVASPAEIAYALDKRICPKIPPLMTLNPLTGAEGLTKEGKPSYDCAATVAALRFCLVEFDDLPLSDQLALWTTVTRRLREAVPVVSIVYSGSKSLHAIVLCPPVDICRDEITEADETRWHETWDGLIRRFGSSDNPAERMDLAPSKNLAQHTRVAGAVRDETGKHQTLLYLDAQLAKDALEVF